MGRTDFEESLRERAPATTGEAEFVGENPLERSTAANGVDEDFRDSKRAGR
jgi:hypothetical protein